MKDKIVYLLLGIFVTLSFAFTQQAALSIFKPARPVSVKAKEFYYSSDAVSFINKSVQEGYQLKIVTSAAEKSSYIVVMEKY